MKTIFHICLAGLILFCLASCMSADQNVNSGRLTIVTTTGIIKDATRNIVGDQADVISLMGPGIDPHLYKPTKADLTELTNADVIIYNGLNLEGKMSDILKKIAKSKPVISMADSLDHSKLRFDPLFHNAADPHIWFDVQKWSKSIAFVSRRLQEIDSKNQEVFETNTKNYLAELEGLHREVKSAIASIPREQRLLITTHDAFGYFGEAYDIDVKGLQGFSTVAEVGLKDITDMVDLIIKREVKALFVESSVSDKTLKAVIEGCKEKGHEVRMGGILYADAMGEEGTPEGTYLGMVRANVKLITAALK